MVAAPTATRTWRMDLRTASRKAWLAFSIKCQRSATWGGVRERLGHSKGVTTAAVARDHSNLSGNRVIGRRRSRSQMIVPYR
jgi:hypothetical protein